MFFLFHTKLIESSSDDSHEATSPADVHKFSLLDNVNWVFFGRFHEAVLLCQLAPTSLIRKLATSSTSHQLDHLLSNGQHTEDCKEENEDSHRHNQRDRRKRDSIFLVVATLQLKEILREVKVLLVRIRRLNCPRPAGGVRGKPVPETQGFAPVKLHSVTFQSLSIVYRNSLLKIAASICVFSIPYWDRLSLLMCAILVDWGKSFKVG